MHSAFLSTRCRQWWRTSCEGHSWHSSDRAPCATGRSEHYNAHNSTTPHTIPHKTRSSATTDKLCEASQVEISSIDCCNCNRRNKLHTKPRTNRSDAVVQRVVNSQDAPTIVGAVNELDWRRVLVTMWSTCSGIMLHRTLNQWLNISKTWECSK